MKHKGNSTVHVASNELLYIEQARLLYGGVPLALFFNMMLSALLVSIMWPVISTSLALVWLLLMALVLVWRFVIYRFYKRMNQRKPALFWRLNFRIVIIATGVVWGFSTVLFFPYESIPYQVFLAFVLAGVSSAAITSLAPDRLSAVGFIAPALFPLIINFVLEGGAMPFSMGLMVALFLVFLSAASSRLQQNLYENMSLRAQSLEQQEALHESEIRFRYILDSCPTAARIAKLGGREVNYFNQSYSALINVSPDQVSGVDPSKYYANPLEYSDIVKRLERGEQILERLVELKIPGVTGSKWALASYLPIQFQAGPAVLGWFHDITERIQIERMKSEFVSTVSHELRTPLTAISGALGLIMGGAVGEVPESARHMIDIAHRNTQRLAFLINDLLDLEKLEAGKMNFEIKLQPVMAVIKQAMEAINTYSSNRGINFELNGVGEDVQICVDSQRLMQVLNNYLSNAIKYSPEKGTVKVNVSCEDGKLRVAVIDQGQGIPEKFRPFVFQKFSQADSSDTRQKGGTGLGLAITRELVVRMGGIVGFETAEGKGTGFYFEFPVG